MVKNLYVIFACVLLLFSLLSLISCNYADKNDNSMLSEMRYEDNSLAENETTDKARIEIAHDETLIEMGKHFYIVSKACELPDSTVYPYCSFRYYIFDDIGEVVKIEELWREPRIEYVDEYILMISVSAGTATIVTHFYSIKNNMFSDYFQSPFLLTDTTIAYFFPYENTHKLIVQDIFYKDIFYQEFFFDDLLVANALDVVESIEYLENGRIIVKYRVGENFTELRTKVLQLIVGSVYQRNPIN